MALERDQVLLHYRLVEQIGEGGMGVVWKAVDTTLDREVAIKFLPEGLTEDADHLARFEREAKVLASLDHPNIASIFGFHECDGHRFLAMEIIPGEDLEERLRRGPVTPDEAVEIGGQIAGALEAAHDSGIVHRDLKPANVRIAPDGRVRVLDFGLAKAVESSPVSGLSPTMSPTVTAFAGTAAGVILGTAAYMSPEQARGRPVDRRTDVWAFGCLFYELLTGRAVFGGETITDVLASILQREPDWDVLPPGTTPATRRLLERCLRKDARQRLRDMADVALLMRESTTEKATTEASPENPRIGAGLLWPGIAGVLAVVLVFLAVTGRLAPRQDSTSAERAQVVAMVSLTDLPGQQYAPSISPDGRQLVYVAEDGGDLDIFLQRVGGENAINLTADYPGDDFQPAFSPDGDQIAFCSRREGAGIFVMGATDEAPRRISDEGFDPAWSPNGTQLIYTTERIADPYSRDGWAYLFVVDLASGVRRKLSEIDAAGADWSPGGVRIAFWTHYETVKGQRDIWTIRSDGTDPRAVTNDAHTDWDPFWSPDGHWLYFLSDRGGSPDLWRIRIDETTGETLDAPQAVTSGIERLTQASMSSDGQHIAVTTQREAGQFLTIPFDPVRETVTGDPVTILSSSNAFVQMDISRDGQWLAYRTSAPTETLYIMRLDGSGRRKLMPEDGHRNRGPTWSPDGRWILFYSNRSGIYDSWAIRTDGTGLRPLTDGAPDGTSAPIWSHDGQRIALGIELGDGDQVATIDLSPDALTTLEVPLDPSPVAGTRGLSGNVWSPDDRLLASWTLDPLGEMSLAVFSFETGEYRVLQYADGRYARATSTRTGARWLDEHRLLFWDPEGDGAMVWDAEGNEIRALQGVIPGPGQIAATPDGRTLVINQTTSESDIWLLTLEK